MPGNIEIKAMVENMEEVMTMAEAIAVEHVTLNQTDTFFNAIKNGIRLKLREEQVASGEASACLISYQRPDVTGPKFSHYVMTAVADPKTMKEVLTMANGMWGQVEKKREVFIAKRNGLKARIHVDDVKNLGQFMEFEVIVENDSEMEEARAFANYLTDYFKITDKHQIPGAYMNLIVAKKSQGESNEES